MFRMVSNYFFKGCLFDIIDVVGVVIVYFVSMFVVGYSNFVSVQNDDVIIGIYVWSVFCFVFIVQVMSQFSSQMVQSFIGCVNNILVVFYGFWFSCKSFY